MTKLRVPLLAAALLLGAAGIGGMVSAQALPVSGVDEETEAGCTIEAETVVTETGGATSTITVRCDGGTCVVTRDSADVVTSECTGDAACAVSEESAVADDGTTIQTLTIQCGDSTVAIQRCAGGSGDQRAVNSGGSQTITQGSNVTDARSTTITSTSTSTSISTSTSTSTSTTVMQRSASLVCGSAGGRAMTEAGQSAREMAQSRRAERTRLAEERRNRTPRRISR